MPYDLNPSNCWSLFGLSSACRTTRLKLKAMNEINGYYQLSIHPSKINYYYTPLHVKSHGNKLLFTSNLNSETEKDEIEENDCMAAVKPKQFESNSHNGRISPVARRKIFNAIDYLVYLAQPKRLPHTSHGKGLLFRLSFITLTLSSSQIHTDNEIMLRVFRPFLMALDRKWKVNNYVWRAERQENGNIHYHLLTDRFIPWLELRNVWNRCQQNLGYVTRYRENQLLWHREGFRFRKELEFVWDRAAQYKAYREGILHDWQNPNSTDVHSLKLVSNVRDYFAKYMTKSSQSSNINGRLWGCSYALTKLSGATVAIYNKIDDDLEKIQKDRSIRVYQTDFYTVIFITILILTRLGCTELLEVWYSYVDASFPMYRPPGLFQS